MRANIGEFLENDAFAAALERFAIVRETVLNALRRVQFAYFHPYRVLGSVGAILGTGFAEAGRVILDPGRLGLLPE